MVTVQESQMAFPVLVRSSVGLLDTALDVDDLTSWTRAAFKREHHKGLFLFDTTGQSWEVTAAEFVEGIGRWGGWSLLGERQIRVRLYVEPRDHLNFEQLKKVVQQAMDLLPHQWDATVGVEPEEYRAYANAASTIPDLVHMFRGAGSLMTHAILKEREEADAG